MVTRRHYGVNMYSCKGRIFEQKCCKSFWARTTYLCMSRIHVRVAKVVTVHDDLLTQ